MIQIPELLTKKAIDYRRDKYNPRIKELIKSRIRLGNEDLKFLLDEDIDVTTPYNEQLNKLGINTDLITLTGQYENKLNFALFSCVMKNSIIIPSKAIGKTHLILDILGVEVPEKNEDLDRFRGKFFDGKSNSKLKLISLDWAYIGANNSRLVMSPPKGELGVCDWDFRRHVFRRTKPDYKIGDSHTPEGMYHMLYLQRGFHLSRNLFVDLTQRDTYEIQYIFTLVKMPQQQKIDVELKEGSEDTLLTILKENPFYAPSTLWERNREEHLRRVDEIVSSIDNLPQMYQIGITPTETHYPITEAKHLMLGTLQKELYR